MVGFQTKLKYPEQVRIFKQIPGLQNANFVRLGGLHRNTFINSPEVLTSDLRLKNAPHIRMCGQITGVEGYLESAAMGLICGMITAYDVLGKEFDIMPPSTALGALIAHITCNAESDVFQPMNINFGLFPPIENTKLRGDEKRQAFSDRALGDLALWLLPHTL
jgi:methylenetetrahydrofolate--tRNA-(uracil-5-)-methyltransferase